MSALARAAAPAAERASWRSASWWPLAGVILLAAVLRLSTLDLQSFWYDEAFTPVHVLHSGLGATWRSIVHTENTPPLWYLLAWADARVLGDGEIALRLPSAIAGILTVPVVWAIGAELANRRAALIAALLVAVNPLFVWYSQEARAYALFVLMAALALLCFVRAQREPTRGRMAAFALTGALALLSHYFAVFLLVPMALWLLREPRLRRAALAPCAALALVGLALLPLISAQGGHGTQWIGRWALSSRLQAIPQYYLTGYSGSPLGHGVELLAALPVLAGVALGAWRLFGGSSARAEAPEQQRLRRGVWIALSIAAFAVLAPIVLAVLGADYLAPRNLVAAMIPLTVLLSILLAAIDLPRTGIPARARAALPIGGMLAAVCVAAFLVLSLDVDFSPRLQRGNWRELARVLGSGSASGGGGGAGAGGERAITTVELGAAPLEYYLPPLHNLARHGSVRVSEIDETGYAPLRRGAGSPPAAGFRLAARVNVDGLIAYRFVSSVPRLVSEAHLRRHVITLAHPEVLVPAHIRTFPVRAEGTEIVVVR